MVKNKKDTPRVKELKHQARRRSIKEGIFATGKNAFGTQYLSPFAIAINMNNSMVAMLTSIGGLLGPVTQMFSSKLIEKHSRKKIVLYSVFWESMIWLPLILIGLLFYKGIITNILPLFFTLIFAFHIITTSASGPAWFSWMGDIVDDEYRGRWFAKRNLIHGFILIILSLSASFFLDFFKKQGWLMFGFMILFFIAMTCRLISWHLFKKQYEPKIKLKKDDYFSFWDFLLKSPKNNFGKFTLFRATLAFAQSISTPLFAIYLLRNLQFSYHLYMIIVVMGSVFSIALIGLWGKFADRYGNYKTMVITSIFTPTIPILWTLSTSALYLIFVPAIIGGLAWSGFNLASGNFIYDNVSQKKRGFAVSYYNMLMGIGIFLGAGLGAILIKYLPEMFSLQPIILIFILGGIARIISVIIWLPHLKEVRKTTKFSGKSAFKNIVLKEMPHTLNEEAHQIISIKKYFTYK